MGMCGHFPRWTLQRYCFGGRTQLASTDARDCNHDDLELPRVIVNCGRNGVVTYMYMYILLFGCFGVLMTYTQKLTSNEHFEKRADVDTVR